MRSPVILLLVSLALTTVSGCTVEKRDSAAKVSSAAALSERSGNSAAQEENAEALLKSRLASRSREVGRLQLQLLAKQAEINQLLISHERVLQEAVRANTRLRSFDSRADTVATIAEATMTIENAKQTAGEAQQPALIHAEKLLDSSRKEMRAGNLDAASYLATKALSLAQPPAQTASHAQNNKSGEPEALFVVPIAMRVKKTSNVREMPRIDSKTLFQLNSGIEVKALGYSDLWIQIITQLGQQGWIYYSLLEHIDPAGQDNNQNPRLFYPAENES